MATKDRTMKCIMNFFFSRLSHNEFLSLMRIMRVKKCWMPKHPSCSQDAAEGPTKWTSKITLIRLTLFPHSFQICLPALTEGNVVHVYAMPIPKSSDDPSEDSVESAQKIRTFDDSFVSSYLNIGNVMRILFKINWREKSLPIIFDTTSHCSINNSSHQHRERLRKNSEKMRNIK